jgi:hypothetical protein
MKAPHFKIILFKNGIQEIIMPGFGKTAQAESQEGKQEYLRHG